MDVHVQLVLLFSLLAVIVSGYEYDPDYLVPPKCPPCDAKSCPLLTFCVGKIVKDHCGCCPRCSSDLFQPHVVGPPTPTVSPTQDANVSDNPCEKRRCPKFKVCVINMQGLPICTCPSDFVCTRGERKDKQGQISVCGSDGITYESRCHLRIANCNNNRRIKRMHPGPCTENEIQALVNTGIREDTNEISFGRGMDNTDDEFLNKFTKAKRRKLKQKKKKDKKRNRKERKRQKKEKNKKRTSRSKRQKRMKRRNEEYDLYSRRYGQLIGRHTQWSRSQVRKSKI